MIAHEEESLLQEQGQGNYTAKNPDKRCTKKKKKSTQKVEQKKVKSYLMRNFLQPK